MNPIKVVLFSAGVLFFSLLNAQNSSFYIGFHSGVFLASKKSAEIYNGLGTFGIKRVYDQPNLEAQITEELVYPFTLSEVPKNMKYSPSLSLGGAIGIVLENENAIFISADILNLTIEDAYTVNIEDPNELEPVITPFAITGKEKRLNFDLGYKAFFETENETIRPYMKIGVNALYTEFVSNQIYIGNLGLYSIYPEGFQLQNAKKSGFGLGLFGGIGINYELTNSTSVELEYSLKYSSVALSEPKIKGLNHGVTIAFVWGK